MSLILILNVVLGCAVVVMVLAPLAWAIVTAQRDEPPAARVARGPLAVRVPTSQAARRARPARPASLPG